ncbi:MAG: hypothetical protein QM733_24695 [Ilumatobacteraceae bacterium]
MGIYAKVTVFTPEDAIAEGKKQGRIEGWVEGWNEGRNVTLRKTVMNLIKTSDFPDEKIAEISRDQGSVYQEGKKENEGDTQRATSGAFEKMGIDATIRDIYHE